ncbi:hypothetical protein [Methylobacterium brachiatum]|uniref:Uncharacterized protein n=1 Tax=Methylobacterium brachiatum TaxID=269660 RepID=A0ABV1R4M1_9HYPH
MKTAGLLGREFKHREHDGFSLMREFYATNFGIEVPDVARPDADAVHRDPFRTHSGW